MASIRTSQQNRQMLDPKTIEKAVKALLKWRNKKSSEKIEKSQLFDNDDDFIYLVLTLKKIPDRSRINAYKIPLPHHLYNPEASEFCLIVDDRAKKDEIKRKIEKEKIPISKVFKFSKLKSDYRAFEAKRKLCGEFDMFFADKRVVPLLPKVLGRCFYKKKLPVPVEVRKGDLKGEIESVCRSGMLFLRSGTCCVVKVGKVSMTVEEIVENVVEGINGIADVVPSKWGNVRSFHLKLLDSLALPVYQAVPDLRLRIEGARSEGEVEYVGEELEGKKSGKVVKKRGKIHEVRYMDHDNDGGKVLDKEDLGSDDEELDLGDLLDKMRETRDKKDGVGHRKLNAENWAKKAETEDSLHRDKADKVQGT